jgi:hypothetical protein
LGVEQRGQTCLRQLIERLRSALSHAKILVMGLSKFLQSKFILPVLIVVLLVMVALNQWISAWHYVIPSEPGKLLYSSTFDNFDDEWQQYQGRLSAEIVDGVMQITADNAQSGPFSVTKPHFSNFDLQVQTQPIGGPLDNGYGVIFRLQDPDNYYLFLVSSDGYYQVSRVVNGVEKVISTWLASPAIQQGVAASQDSPDVGVNRLRVIAYDSSFQFFVNGQQVQLCVPNNRDAESTVNPITGECIDGTMLDTLTDASFASGQLGVVVKSLNEPGVIVNFDNLLVYGSNPVNEQAAR